jgi:hypothetical protein
LAQFDKSDLPVAHALLRSLKLVSHSEFDHRITQSLFEISNSTGRRMAIFPVKPYKDPAWCMEKRQHYGSAEKIGQMLTNLERLYPSKFQVAPTVKGMRSEKTRHVILADDIIGTGKRITDYCYNWLSKSVKSWCSYHRCDLWVVTYAGYSSSIKALTDRFNYLASDRFTLYLNLHGSAKRRSVEERIQELCRRYAKRTSKSGAALGFGELMTRVIFQHGCPNNAPAILWASGPRWTPLFPNRGIPEEFKGCFEAANSGGTAAELLWDSAQYGLALAILDRMNSGRLNPDDIKIIVALGLLARGVRPPSLPGKSEGTLLQTLRFQ